MVKISVIIPAYNCAKTIHNTVESVLKSGLSNLEILIIDDGSVDETANICDGLAQENACIRCYHQENAGVSAARNKGIREASGEYLWFVDADDSVKEGSLLLVEEILRKQAPDMLVFGMEFDYYHKGKIYRKDVLIPPLEGMSSISECKSSLFDLFVSNSLSSLCNRIIKRSVIMQMGSLLQEDMIIYEDLEFSLRALKQCATIYFYPEAVYKYRQSEDEGNASRRLKKISHIPAVLDKVETALADESDKARILLALYLTLAREKISVSQRNEIEIVCSDFKSWIDKHNLQPTIIEREYPLMLYQKRAFLLIAKRTYSKIRHSAANWLKQMIGDFRKW